MPQQTLFICQPYVTGNKGALKPESAVSYTTEAQARQRAQRMMDSGRVAGVDVVRQTADLDWNDYDEPVFLARLGKVPRTEN